MGWLDRLVEAAPFPAGVLDFQGISELEPGDRGGQRMGREHWGELRNSWTMSSPSWDSCSQGRGCPSARGSESPQSRQRPRQVHPAPAGEPRPGKGPRTTSICGEWAEHR